MKYVLNAIAALLATTVLSSAAVAQTMDFETFPDTAQCPDGAAGVTQNGLSLIDDTPFPAMDSESCVFGSMNTFMGPGPIVTNGTNVFGWCGSCTPNILTITLMREDGTPFELRSIDFSRVPGAMGSTLVNITGFPAGGGAPVTVQHTIDSDAWITVNFNQFGSVERVEIAKSAVPTIDTLLDNIVTGAASGNGSGATAVPVMGPLATLTLGLLVLMTALVRMRREPPISR